MMDEVRDESLKSEATIDEIKKLLKESEVDFAKNNNFWWMFLLIVIFFAFAPMPTKSKEKEVKDMTEQEKRDVENIMREVETPSPEGDANWAIKMLMNGMLGDAPIRPMTESEQIHYLMGKVEAYEKMMMGGK